MSDINGQVGQRIRQARRQAGIKQKDIAAAVGLTRSSITNIEQGRQQIRVELVYQIADYLRVPVLSLLPSLNSNDDYLYEIEQRYSQVMMDVQGYLLSLGIPVSSDAIREKRKELRDHVLRWRDEGKKWFRSSAWDHLERDV